MFRLASVCLFTEGGYPWLQVPSRAGGYVQGVSTQGVSTLVPGDE